MRHDVGLGIIFALMAAALYGTVPNFVRGAFLNGVPAIESSLVRTFILAVAFAITGVLQGKRFHIPPPARLAFFTQALATLVISVSYLASVQFIPVGLAVMIFFTFPVLIAVFAPLYEGERPGLAGYGSALLAFGGLALAIGPSFEGLNPIGLGLAATASAGAAFQFFTGRSISRYVDPAVFGSLVHAVIFPPVLAVAVYLGGGTLKFLPGGAAQPAAYLLLAGLSLAYVIAYMIHMMSLRAAPASVVAPFFNLEPVCTMGLAAVLFSERLTAAQYGGGLLVLAALIISGYAGRKKARS
jgi:drug/metabolite transporter (DMT)-like permease